MKTNPSNDADLVYRQDLSLVLIIIVSGALTTVFDQQYRIKRKLGLKVVREESRPYTAFALLYGLHHFKLIPLSPHGAPATIQRMMDIL